MKKILTELINQATVASEKAYAPYSGYSVGAAIFTGSDRIFTGSNIENASFGLSICAERVAIAKAISSGETDIECIAVYAGRNELPIPCGACLQMMAEFNPRLAIILVNGQGKIKKTNLKKLLPEPFTLRRK